MILPIGKTKSYANVYWRVSNSIPTFHYHKMGRADDFQYFRLRSKNGWGADGLDPSMIANAAYFAWRNLRHGEKLLGRGYDWPDLTAAWGFVSQLESDYTVNEAYNEFIRVFNTLHLAPMLEQRREHFYHAMTYHDILPVDTVIYLSKLPHRLIPFYSADAFQKVDYNKYAGWKE